MSGIILFLTNLQCHVFLINSRLGHFTAASSKRGRRPFSRSYRTILPSSLAMNHSSTLGFSPRLPVSVYGTGTIIISFRKGFLGSLIRITIHSPRRIVVLSRSVKSCGFTNKTYTYSLQRYYSVSTRIFHYFVTPSLIMVVSEY